MELAFFFVKVHDVEAVGLFGPGIRNAKVKPVSMAVGGRIHGSKEGLSGVSAYAAVGAGK